MNTTHNTFCLWQPIEDMYNRKYQCVHCQRIITVIDDHPEPPPMLCRYSLIMSNTDRSLSANLLSFVSDTSNAENMETCSEEVTISRYNICQSCEFLHNHTCNKCGCIVSRDKQFASKLIMKNEHCPIGRW